MAKTTRKKASKSDIHWVVLSEEMFDFNVKEISNLLGKNHMEIKYEDVGTPLIKMQATKTEEKTGEKEDALKNFNFSFVHMKKDTHKVDGIIFCKVEKIDRYWCNVEIKQLIFPERFIRESKKEIISNTVKAIRAVVHVNEIKISVGQTGTVDNGHLHSIFKNLSGCQVVSTYKFGKTNY